MRFRSVSKRERSKYFFGPHGIQLLSFVAMTAFSRPASTRRAPSKAIFFTWMLPSSRHAVPRRASIRPAAVATARVFERDASGLYRPFRQWISERGVRLTRRKERAYREYASDAQRRQVGCPAG